MLMGGVVIFGVLQEIHKPGDYVLARICYDGTEQLAWEWSQDEKTSEECDEHTHKRWVLSVFLQQSAKYLRELAAFVVIETSDVFDRHLSEMSVLRYTWLAHSTQGLQTPKDGFWR